MPQNCDVLCYERHALSHRFSCVDSFSFDFIIEALLMDVKFEANVNEWFPFQKKSFDVTEKSTRETKRKKKFNNNELDKTRDKMRR